MAQEYRGPLDYIDVATRIVEFREKYPTGSLQQERLEFVRDFAGKDWVVYTASAYRFPDDPCPGIGTAWEPVPGPTKFTRDSEVQNAETAAWGRAMVAALAVDTRNGVASMQEVRNRQVEEMPTKMVPVTNVQIVTRDWDALIEKLETKAGARALYKEAVRAKADKSVIDAIEAKAATLGD